MVATDGVYLVACWTGWGCGRCAGAHPVRPPGHRLGAGRDPRRREEIVETGQLDPGEAFAVDLRTGAMVRPRELVRAWWRARRSTSRSWPSRGWCRSPRGARRAAVATRRSPSDALLNLFGWTQERVRTVQVHGGERQGADHLDGLRPAAARCSRRAAPAADEVLQADRRRGHQPADRSAARGTARSTSRCTSAPPRRARERARATTRCRSTSSPRPFLTADQFARIRDGAAARPARWCSTAPSTTPATARPPAPSALRTGSPSCRARRVKRGASAATASIVHPLRSRRAAPHRARRHPRLPLPMLLVACCAAQRAGRRGAGAATPASWSRPARCRRATTRRCSSPTAPTRSTRTCCSRSAWATRTVEQKLVDGLDDDAQAVMSKMGITRSTATAGRGCSRRWASRPRWSSYYLPGVAVAHRRAGAGGPVRGHACPRARMGENSPHRETEVDVYRKEVWQELQATARGNDRGAYERFLAAHRSETPPVYLRDLLGCKRRRAPLPLDEVASDTEEIIAPASAARRCRTARCTGWPTGRSRRRSTQFGALSNCGEGGEDPRRDRGGAWAESRSRDPPGRLRPLRRRRALPGQRRRAVDQDRPGRQARRGRACCPRPRSPRRSRASARRRPAWR